jgi:hypothetical protein
MGVMGHLTGYNPRDVHGMMGGPQVLHAKSSLYMVRLNRSGPYTL